MSVYIFGQRINKRKTGRDTAAMLHKICIEEGGTGFVEIFESHSYKSWFTGPGRGEPFDRKLAARVMTRADMVRPSMAAVTE
jgi:hypothetical protein